jgi:hypothetical protein
MYIIEFCIALCIIAGLVLYGLFLVSPVLSVVLGVALAVWLLKIEARAGVAIVGSTYGLLALVTMGARFAF